MARAIQLARRGLYTTHPNPRVGCVLVKEQQVIAEGWHQIAGQGHAEVNALHMAGSEARGATAYVTLEPCSHHGKTPPCAKALMEAGVARVVSAMVDPNPLVSGRGHKMLEEQGIKTAWGLLEAQARALNPGFIKRMTSGRPWVWCKSASSLDGRTAMASGESHWITGPAARQDVQRLRARCEAIITGVQTILHDDPSYTVRPEQWPAGEWPESFEPIQPIRVVLDSRLSMPADSKILALPGQTWVVCARLDVSREKTLKEAGAQIFHVPDSTGSRVDLGQVLDLLGQHQVNEVLVEAGAELTGAFIGQGLVDEWWVYMAPSLLGDSARPLCRLPGMDTMTDKIGLRLKDIRQVGDDVRLRFGFAEE